MKPNWNEIKAEYIAGGISQRQLALEHGVSFSALKERAQKEKWTDARQKTAADTAQKLVDAITDAKIEQIEKIVEKLLKQTYNASGQLTKRQKTIREIEELADGRQRVTVRTEYENGNVVDRAGLKMLAQTAQALDEILRKQRLEAQGENTREEIHVIFDPYPEDD